jgi:hypothetical protein
VNLHQIFVTRIGLDFATVKTKLGNNRILGGIMKKAVVIALFFGLVACSNHTMIESQRSNGLPSEDEADNEVYEVPSEEGAFVTGAIRAEELAIISQEVVETYTSVLPTTAGAVTTSTEAPKVTDTPKNPDAPKSPEPPKYPEAPKKPKPALPPEIQSKLAACYPQWEKLPWANDAMIDIRTFTLDVQKLRKTNLQLAGSTPELVFVKIDSATRIAKVSLSMMNKKALYCVDIDAGKVINKLELVSVCGAKVGTVSIDSGRVAKNISFREVCP